MLASPFVKWAGGKAHLTRHLRPLVPVQVRNYYEPFLGGGALFFSTFSMGLSFQAVLSDTNEELISTFRVVKDMPGELIESLGRLKRQFRQATSKI